MAWIDIFIVLTNVYLMKRRMHPMDLSIISKKICNNNWLSHIIHKGTNAKVITRDHLVANPEGYLQKGNNLKHS